MILEEGNACGIYIWNGKYVVLKHNRIINCDKILLHAALTGFQLLNKAG